MVFADPSARAEKIAAVEPRERILSAAGQEFARELGTPWPGLVYQWHREGFDMPSGVQALAEGDIFPHQAFRAGNNAFGLQFHPEVTYAMMCRWTVRAHERLAMPGACPRDHHLEGWFLHDGAVRRWLDAFLDRWLAPVGASRQVAVTHHAGRRRKTAVVPHQAHWTLPA